MVEFALPKNSKVTAGKTWPKPSRRRSSPSFASTAMIPTPAPIRASTPISSIAAIAAR